MTTDAIPVLHVGDATVAAAWYRRLGFEIAFEHRFGPGFPRYVGLRREGAQVHLSEHAGDATPHGLVYVWVGDVDAIAQEFDQSVAEQPWAREVELVDPAGNRLRVGQPVPEPDVDTVLGAGTTATLLALETAMWAPATRGDREWMDAHLTPDFTEIGYSGRTFTRHEILAVEVDATDASLDHLAVRPLGRDAALVTSRSQQARGAAHRSSVWVRADGRWLLAFHQGTPEGSSADEGA